MTAHYRQAIASEIGIIVDFQLAMAKETENLHLLHDTVSKGVSKIFERPQIGSYYVCSIDDKVVGVLLILPEWSDWRNGAVWWIHSLYILPEHRGHKLFSGFFSFLEKAAQEFNDVRGLRLYVDKRNVAAQSVYKKLGMTDEHYTLFEKML